MWNWICFGLGCVAKLKQAPDTKEDLTYNAKHHCHKDYVEDVHPKGVPAKEREGTVPTTVQNGQEAFALFVQYGLQESACKKEGRPWDDGEQIPRRYKILHIKSAWRAVVVCLRPHPKEPLGSFGRGNVAKVQHCNQNDNKSTVHHLGNGVVFADFAYNGPKQNAKCVKVQHSKGSKASKGKPFVNEIGDEGVYEGNDGKDNASFHI